MSEEIKKEIKMLQLIEKNKTILESEKMKFIGTLFFIDECEFIKTYEIEMIKKPFKGITEINNII